MFWNNSSYEVKTAQLLSQFKNKFPSLASAGSLLFINWYVRIF